MERSEFLTKLEEARNNTSSPSLSDITIQGADLRGLNCAEFVFVDCDFSRCDFSRGDFAAATFKDCRLLNTDFSYSNLFDARFESSGNTGEQTCDLTRANLSHVVANPAHFIRVNLGDITAESARFQGANFDGSNLKGACLNLANLDQASNYQLDGCQTHLTEFSAQADDDWSVLRRTYTGLNLFLNLIPVTVFVLILTTKTLLHYVAGYLKAAALSIASFCELDPGACSSVKLLSVVSGWDHGFMAFVFVLFSLVFNGGRYFVTRRVVAMREAEDRSQRSPERAAYARYKTYHDILKCMFVINIVLFLWNLGDVLLTGIPVIQ